VITVLLAGGLSLIFTLLVTPLFIRLFSAVGWGQFINEEGPNSHHVKKGTPTMGGLVVVTGVVVSFFLASWLTESRIVMSSVLVLFMMIGLATVGFIDDFIKTHKRRSLGLAGWPKVFGQVIVAVIFGLLAINFPDANGVTPASMSISFIRNLDFSFLQFGLVLGIILFLIWIVLIVTATSNAVNVTDGLDGLATGASIFVIGPYVLINFWQQNQSCSNPRLSAAVADKCYEVRDPLDLAIVAAAIVGGLIGFLWWNTSPAKIFLGDTGSMALGGALAALAILSQTELLMVILAGLFVIDTGSVIVQRAYFKITKGKRIFLMSPIHHHFELKGWAEVTVVVRFWIISALFVVAGVSLFYAEWLTK